MTKRAATLADDRIITAKELRTRIPLDRSTIWRMVQKGQFPKPIQLTPSRIGWRLSAVLAWLEARELDPVKSRPNFK